MRGEILKRQHVAGGERDYRVGIGSGGEFAESAEDRNEIFDGAVVVDNDDQRALSAALPKHEQQGFGGGSEAGDTHTPRALLELGGYTREGGKVFYVREEFADEGKQHAGIF
jgi:hypothetical protein